MHSSGGSRGGAVPLPQLPPPTPRLTPAQAPGSPKLTTPRSTSYLLSDAYRRGATRAASRSVDYARTRTFYNPARNTLYARYSPDDWIQNNNKNFTQAQNENNASERFRANTWRALQDVNARTRSRQEEATRKLAERAAEVKMWKMELNAEINSMQTETANLKEFARVMNKALADSAVPQHVAEECLIAREQRQGVDLVNDDVEDGLTKEVQLIKKTQEYMRTMLKKASIQLKLNRAAQDACERDSKDKHQAEETDQRMQQLRNSGTEIGFYPGIESWDKTVSVHQSWLQYTRNNILRSQRERSASERLRTQMEECLRDSANKLWTSHASVNQQLTTRVQETTDTRNQLQAKLSQTMQEIFDLDKQIRLMRQMLSDIEMPLKVNQTRLQERTTRPNVEKCHDYAMQTLLQENHELQKNIQYLRHKLAAAQAGMARLMKNRAMLEHDIAVKQNSLDIDQAKCLGMRQALPTDGKIGPIFQMPMSA